METKHTKEDLKRMQALPLSVKIGITQARIMEWYNHWQGKVYVSFSGGKDSTVLLDIARRMYPDIEAVFIDTGLEYPEIKDFIRTKENVTWLKPEMSFNKVVDTYGYPVISKNVSQYIKEIKRTKSEKLKSLRLDGVGSRTGVGVLPKKYRILLDAPFMCSDECCNVLKKKPAHKFDKLSGKKPIIATMADEGMQRTLTWMKNGCNAFNKTNPSSQPISFWLEQDVLQYIKQFNIPYCSVYGEIVEENGELKTTGEQRTGCMFCMFGVHFEKEPNRFQRMRLTHPKQYDYCINKLGIGEVLDYIGVPYK